MRAFGANGRDDERNLFSSTNGKEFPVLHREDRKLFSAIKLATNASVLHTSLSFVSTGGRENSSPPERPSKIQNIFAVPHVNQLAMSFIKYIFTPNYEKYEGVRPVNIYLLRLLYFLMFVGVGLQTWATLINHQGAWDHTKAVAFCVWAAYPTLSIFGLVKPLKWLPLVIFMIFYKTLWLIVVAYPLWRAGALAGSPADEMAHIFIGAPFVMLIVPWKYVFQNYVMWSSKPK